MMRVARGSVAVTICAIAALVPATGAAAHVRDGSAAGREGGTGRTGVCRGEEALIINVPVWHGTAVRDVVYASAAVLDQIWAEDGDDLICVVNPGPAHDGVEVHGGTGNDTVLTLSGGNLVYAEDGDDIVYLNGRSEFVNGGAGADHVWALGVDSDGIWAIGGPGPDILPGSHDRDVLDGSDGDDILIGADNEDVLFGGDGDDTLIAGSGPDDYLDGQAGDDDCSGDAGTTYLNCEVVANSPQLPIGY